MFPPYLNSFYYWNARLCPPIGFLLNFTLLWLILHRTPKLMWMYSRVLLQTCIMDIMLLSVYLFGIPCATFIDNKVVLLFEGYFTRLFQAQFDASQRNWGLWNLFLLFHFFYNLDVFSIPVQFLYRYLGLNRDVKIGLTRYLLFLTVPFTASFSTTWFGINSIVTIPSDSRLSYSSNSTILVTLSIIDLNEKPVIIVLPMTDLAAPNLFIMFLLYSICYCTIIYCGQQIIKYVGVVAMSPYLRELHKQLTKTLIIFASYPIIIESFISILFLATFIKSQAIINAALLVNATISWLPVLNPLANMWTFLPYREALISALKKYNQILPAY